MPPATKPGLAIPIGSKPHESRRWLKPQVPKEQLHRLAPPRPKPERLGLVDYLERTRRLIRAWWLWLAAALLLYMLGIWYAALVAGALSFIFYHTAANGHPALYVLEPGFNTDSADFRNTMAGMTGMPLVDGNRVTLYNNGDEFYPAMLEAIESAQASVTLEQFIFLDSLVGRRFAEALAERAREGVLVKLLVDAVGSSTLGEEILGILEDGGCQLAWFRPIHWYTLNRANLRTHRKSLIIDGRIAFTGGAGIADHWLGTARDRDEWRDMEIRVDGPAVAVQQSGFAQNWLLSTGEILSGPEFFPEPQPCGDVEVQTILSSPSSGADAAATMHLIAIQCARRYLHISNPYFIPGARLIDMLGRACQRGVSVKLMVAGRHNDTWWARQNSLRLYGKLLEAGVEIYEFQPTMLHQKTMVVDGVWATVGTANFDNRSFALSEETNICFHDPALVAELDATFQADLASSQRIDLEVWRKRGLVQSVKELAAALIEDQV
ncbi:MAG TPA: phospholipase D-like domain-containing protein [Bryobacteraceae bacterium]|nr:phospholipase D-like domain-containing protein [Bryobacteraceae bacterium]